MIDRNKVPLNVIILFCGAKKGIYGMVRSKHFVTACRNELFDQLAWGKGVVWDNL